MPPTRAGPSERDTTVAPEPVIPTRSIRGIELTELGLGGAQLGNLHHEVSDDDVTSVVETAWDAGMRHFDTAPHYGLGLSERRLGALLRERPREEFVLSTKVGRLLVPDPAGAGRMDDQGFAVPATTRRAWDFSRDGVRRSIHESLERLGLDRIDIAYLHDAEGHWQQALDEAAPALVELRDEGVVRAVGAGMNIAGHLTELVRTHDVDLVMCAGRHTLLEQADDLLDAALERGVGVVAAGIYNSGLLARPRPDAGARYDYEAAPRSIVARPHALADACEAHGVTLPEAALAFPLRHPAVISVVVGAESPAEVAHTVDRYHRAVPDALWEALVAGGLLPRRAAGSA
jgi:D-threo-aldose 1-dehydrogenase